MDLKNIKFEKLLDDDKIKILSYISTIDIVSRYEFLIRIIDRTIDNDDDISDSLYKFINNPEFDDMMSNLKIVNMAEGELNNMNKNEFTSEIDYYASNIAYRTVLYDICNSEEDLETSKFLKEKLNITLRRSKLKIITENGNK